MQLLIFRLLIACLTANLVLFAGPTAATTNQPPIDLVVVIKSERVLYLYVDGMPIKSFRIGLGDHPAGDKRRSGDERTPEGAYILDWRNPDSLYHLSIHISYPNARDRAWARAHGVDPGGNIMIHGQPDYAFEKRTGDWTDGCIAVSDKAMDIIWRRVPTGTPIHIYP